MTVSDHDVQVKLLETLPAEKAMMLRELESTAWFKHNEELFVTRLYSAVIPESGSEVGGMVPTTYLNLANSRVYLSKRSTLTCLLSGIEEQTTIIAELQAAHRVVSCPAVYRTAADHILTGCTPRKRHARKA